MIEWFFLNRIDTEPAGAAVGSQHYLLLLAFPDETETLLSFSELTKPWAKITLKTTIIKLVPSIKVDVAPLYEEAERVEGFVRRLREQAQPATEPSTPHSMYM